MAILPSHLIGARINDGSLRIEPFSGAQIQPASYDLHLGERLLRLPYGVTIDPEQDQSALWQDVPLRKDGRWILGQGQLYLGVTVERITLPLDIVALIHGVSSLGRLGLLVHVTAGLIDPGNWLNPTLELVSLGGSILLRPGQRIAQLTFHQMSEPTKRPYNGRYQGDREPTPSRLTASAVRTHNDDCAGCGSPADAARIRESVAGSLAAMAIAESIEQGKTIEIPSLGATYSKADGWQEVKP